MPKAVNLALSLVAPPLGADDDTPEWWRARLIQLRTYMRTADRQAHRRNRRGRGLRLAPAGR